MNSHRRSILLSPLFILLAAALLPAQQPQSQPLTVKLANTAHCDADVRITQEGRAVVSRATVEQLSFKTLNVELKTSAPLQVQVVGRQCHFSYSIDVPVGNAPILNIEVADKRESVIARPSWQS